MRSAPNREVNRPVARLPRIGTGTSVSVGLFAIVVVTLAEYAWTSRTDALIAWSVVGAAGIGWATWVVRSKAREIRAHRLAAAVHREWLSMLAGPHEYARVDESELNPQELAYFKSVQPAFEAMSFRHLVDLRNATMLPDWPRQRQVHRILMSEDGHIRVTLDQEFGLDGAAPGMCTKPRILLTTELSNGRFAVTASGRDPGEASDVAAPGIGDVDWQQFSAASAPSELLEAHRRHVAAAIDLTGTVKPMRLRSVEDAKASIERLQRLFGRHARPLDLAEQCLRAAESGSRDAAFMRLVAKELTRLQSCRQCGYNLTGNTAGVCPECGTPDACARP